MITLLINFSTCIAALLITLLALIIAIINNNSRKWTRRFFITFFSIITVYISSNLLGQIAEQFYDSAFLTQFAIFIESLASSLLMPILTFFLLYCCKENMKERAVTYIVAGLWFVYFLLLVYTQFTTGIYYVSADNTYHRGEMYPLLLVPPVLIMLANTIALFIRRKKLTLKQFTAFFIYIVVPMAAMIAQMFMFGLYLIVLATTLSSIIMFIFILTDNFEQYIRQREENSDLKTKNAISQMRPHFIYNTMTSIYYLIDQDTEKAKKVTLDFTTYLKKNLKAISKKGTIPFSEELQHTQAYLAVEQVGHEGKLFVAFDTPCTMFRLPPLTLQPIVENAVKHGFSSDNKPLYISIQTSETENVYLITVNDTGIGIKENDADKPFTTIQNIRERLKVLCGGELSIKARKEGGTKVTIFIPKMNNKNN